MRIKDIFGALIVILLIYLIIAVLWMFAEKLMYGKIESRLIDDFVAIFFAVSIYFNIK